MINKISNNVAFGSKVKLEVVNNDESILGNYPKKKAVLDKFIKQIEADGHNDRTVTIKIGVDNSLMTHYKRLYNPFVIKVDGPEKSGIASCSPGFIGTYLCEEKWSINELTSVYKEALKKAGMKYPSLISRIFNRNK